MTEQDIIWGILHEQTSLLNDMQDHYKCIKKIGIARGVVLGSQQGDQAIPMKDPYASDPEVSSGSSEETSDDGPEVPQTCDPKISIQSDSSVLLVGLHRELDRGNKLSALSSNTM